MGGTALFFGSHILYGIRQTLGTSVDGANIPFIVESDPFAYITEGTTGDAYPAIVIEPIKWPSVDNAFEPQNVLQRYEANIFYVEHLRNLNTEGAYRRVRDRTSQLAQRIANKQSLSLPNPLDGTSGNSFVHYVEVSEIDLRPPEHRQMQEAGQRKVISRFTTVVEVITPKPAARTDYTVG